MDDRLVSLRHSLHTHAALADDEAATAAIVRDFLRPFAPDELVESLGGHGLAAVFRGSRPGPAVLVRAELDALPVPETLALPYASRTAGVAHKCGHDGHMAMVAGLAPLIAADRSRPNTVILLFQPAEETGAGAQRVLKDPRLAALHPDWVFALHNLPGYPLGRVVTRSGAFASASRGLIVELSGATSHAAEPHRGRSPALAVANLIEGLSALPQFTTGLEDAAQVTVIHALVGTPAFGTSPGDGRVCATLRSHSMSVIEGLSARATELAHRIGATWELEVRVSWTESFPATENDPGAVAVVREAAKVVGLEAETREEPFAWSEDFGHFTAAHRGALVGLGAGEEHPPLHHPRYDFPDSLLSPGRDLLATIIERIH
jgi:amidohydrolase